MIILAVFRIVNVTLAAVFSLALLGCGNSGEKMSDEMHREVAQQKLQRNFKARSGRHPFDHLVSIKKTTKCFDFFWPLLIDDGVDQQVKSLVQRGSLLSPVFAHTVIRKKANMEKSLSESISYLLSKQQLEECVAGLSKGELQVDAGGSLFGLAAAAAEIKKRKRLMSIVTRNETDVVRYAANTALLISDIYRVKFDDQRSEEYLELAEYLAGPSFAAKLPTGTVDESFLERNKEALPEILKAHRNLDVSKFQM